MAAFAKLYTFNNTNNWIWVTIYDLAKTTHLDYGWNQPGTLREWTSGNYFWGSFYYVRAEVKAGTSQDGANIFDTTVQVNPQTTDNPLPSEAIQGIIDSKLLKDHVGIGTAVVLMGDGAGKYWWDHYN